MTKLQISFRSAVLSFAVLVVAGPVAFSQDLFAQPKTVTLAARRQIEGEDNYTQAVFSFKYGTNGDDAVKVTRNNWDILFGNSPYTDSFDVSMVTDDCSRIKDLGKRDWLDFSHVPVLPAYAEPTREAVVTAVVGHMYVVHVKDRDNDHYALFRVESLRPKKLVTISWKLVPPPE